MFKKLNSFIIILAIALSVTGCTGAADKQFTGNGALKPSPVENIPPEQRSVDDLILLGAREEANRRVNYDASYQVIDYPGGDVSSDRGACTDVVIRAFRHAGIDLQQLIHEDMSEKFDIYPQKWGLNGPDPNIDHRRVPNQMTFFKRYGRSLTLSVANSDLQHWKWGDVVYWRFPNGLEHCGVVSDRKNSRGVPLVIHNAGIAVEEDCLTRWEITGHYRYLRDNNQKDKTPSE